VQDRALSLKGSLG